jgi:hypothetical protein
MIRIDRNLLCALHEFRIDRYSPASSVEGKKSVEMESPGEGVEEKGNSRYNPGGVSPRNQYGTHWEKEHERKGKAQPGPDTMAPSGSRGYVCGGVETMASPVAGSPFGFPAKRAEAL